MSGGGGSGSDKGGGGGGPPSVMNPPSKPSKNIPDRGRGQQYTAPKPKPKPKPKPTVTVGGGGGRDIMPVTKPKTKPKVVTKPTTGGGTPKVDVGFQEALRKQKIRQQDPVYGDPDPEVDVDPRDRDSITSFLDNYKANIKANPLQAGLLGALATAYQTKQARSMLEGTPGYEFLDNRGGGSQNQPTTLVGGGADQDANLQKLVSQSSFAKAGIKPVESVAAKWYKNLGSVSNNFAYQSAYANAKAKQQGILGSPTPMRYHAVSESPFYNWLKDNSLNKGIL